MPKQYFYFKILFIEVVRRPKSINIRSDLTPQATRFHRIESNLTQDKFHGWNVLEITKFYSTDISGILT